MSLRVRMTAPRLALPVSAENKIRASLDVRGYTQWHAMARAANWLAGCGGTIAAGMGDSGTAIAAGSSATRRFYAFPRSTNTTWVWSVMLLAGGSSGAHGTVTLDPGSISYDFALKDTTPASFLWTHVPSSLATGDKSIQIAVASSSANSVRVRTIGVYELPRHTLPSTGGSAGVHVDSCSTSQAIYKNTGTADKYSIQAVYEQVRDAKDNCRRQSLLHWYNPSGITTATTTFTNIFRLDPAVQTRHLTSGETVRTVTCAVRALVGGGSPGDTGAEIRVTAASGDSVTIGYDGNVSSATWQTGTFDVETDDFSQAGLIRGGTRDTLAVEIRRTVDAASVTVYGVCIGEGT